MQFCRFLSRQTEEPIIGPMGRGCGRLIHSDFAGATLTLAVSPSLPPSLLLSFTFPSSPFTAHLPRVFHRFPLPIFMYASVLLCCLPPFRSTRPQVGSATLGCRAVRTASSATACLRARGPGNRPPMSAKRFIIWTGCSRVSEWHTSMDAQQVVAGCDA